MNKHAVQYFWDRVIKRGADQCWLWTGTISANGYGQAKINYRCIKAHRLAWAVCKGPIPRGLLVCHKCDNPPCCNPKHLFVGTVQDNSDDMVKKSRAAVGDKNGTRLYPERLLRGDRHPSRTHPERIARGERVNTAFLCARQIKSIRRLSAGGIVRRLLARRFGCSSSNIKAIVLRRTWKHIS